MPGPARGTDRRSILHMPHRERADEATLRRRFEEAGQEQVLRPLASLAGERRESYLAALDDVDLQLVRRLADLARGKHSGNNRGKNSASPASAADHPSLEPPETFPLERDSRQLAQAAEASERGRELLREGRVGYVLVAGGQASRLGFDGPKGLFPVGPVSGRVLFEFHARRLARARAVHGAPVRWYVMTSAANDAETRRAFALNEYYGLSPDDVVFFTQAMIPALGPEGEMLLARDGGLFLAPNGHGGSLQALARAGLLDDARERGIEHLSYFQVDNPLARPADPLFLGLHALARAEMSSKVVAKRDAQEKVGVLGLVDGRLGCIEYSDLPDELRDARDSAGRLRFDAGNIAVHVIDRAFVERLTEGGLRLPWHVARKRMQVLDEAGRPTEVEGTKFETFVFDALGETTASVTLEVDRAQEFSPVKNATGSDSPATARADLCRLFAGWAEGAGRRVPEPHPEHGHPLVEVDPLLAEDAEEFREAAPREPRTLGGGHLWTEQPS